MTAAVALVGRPSDSIGTSVPAAEALLAASGPATPSIAPLPNSASCPLRFASRFSVMYDKHVGSSAPPAGRALKGKPTAGPRSHGSHGRPQSPGLTHGRPTGMTSAGL